ncbi:hypothetical protein FisN_6Hh330 [Fistulifera solaris]|uniref:Uncharacterized protein n=1 Tax=Fistulifera solaris TaxID=1519565 RepID=A0A1Z5K7E7_FISSO|nr:hypothetical protein FisN_6Hh330 [Fistulifera solaris]|eukprot:GAX22082.1 hypothetical protein FisN_6Hh330 [Fistulifera solaris]
MCEGQPDNVGRNHRNTRNRRSRPESGDEGDETSTKHFDAIDSSPAVFRLSDGWKQCQQKPKTPQHLVTLVARNPSTYVWSAPPIIWNEKYLIAPTLSGHILLWDLTKVLRSDVADVGDHLVEDGEGEERFKGLSLHDVVLEPEVSAFQIQTNHTPDLVLNTQQDEKGEAESASTLGDGAAIAQICIGSPAVLGNGNDVLVAVSVAGFVHIFNLNDDSNPNSSFVTSFFATGKTGLQCVTTTSTGAIVVGYRSGRLEAWKLEARKQARKVIAASQAPEKSETTYRKKLLWRGFFSNAPEIRSVLQLQHPAHKISTENNEIPNGSDEFLIATIQQEEMISTAAMIEVLNITAIAKAYQELLQNDESATQVQMDEFSLLARPGMEVIDPTTSLLEPCTSHQFKNRPWVPIGGTDSFVRIELPLEDDSLLACVAILAEGSVLFITTNLVDGEFEWGIRGTHDQFLMSFPAIGAGCSIQTSGEDAVPNIVCCLRGGTSFLIPRIPENKGKKTDLIHTITYPHDIDTDNPPHRVDYFSAGILHYLGDDGLFTKSSIPIMVYCWPGGIIDVYSSELLQEKKTYFRVLFAELLSDGTVEVLREHLLSLTAETLAMRKETWRSACEEVQKLNSSEPILLSDLVSGRLRAFRSLLVSKDNLP